MSASRIKDLTPWLGTALAVAIVFISVWPYMPQVAAAFSDFSIRPPRWDLWAQLSWVVQLHVYAALAALVIGAVILIQRKGSRLHKVLGWGAVLAMSVTALSSLFITGLTRGYSPVHLLSGWVIITLPLALLAIRNRRVDVHRRAMTGMFLGGLLIAGLLTFIPGRVMFEIFFG